MLVGILFLTSGCQNENSKKKRIKFTKLWKVGIIHFIVSIESTGSFKRLTFLLRKLHYTLKSIQKTGTLARSNFRLENDRDD
jgi:hypothetical protein